MKNAMQKDFWREIGHTRSRFFSIMILVALYFFCFALHDEINIAGRTAASNRQITFFK